MLPFVVHMYSHVVKDVHLQLLHCRAPPSGHHSRSVRSRLHRWVGPLLLRHEPFPLQTGTRQITSALLCWARPNTVGKHAVDHRDILAAVHLRHAAPS